MKDVCRAVVTAIIERNSNDGNRYIVVQTRWKASSPYSGKTEIPSGIISPYESVYNALIREVREETGLTITTIQGSDSVYREVPSQHDEAIAFQPFCCQQVLRSAGGLPWVGMVFLCEADGELVAQNTETKDVRWISVQDLYRLVTQHPEQVFPLQLPVLIYYLDFLRDKFQVPFTNP